MSMAIHAPRRLRAHRGEYVVASRQADKKRKRNKPDTQAKVRRNHGKARHIGVVVVCGAVIGFDLGVGKVAEPNIVVNKNET